MQKNYRFGLKQSIYTIMALGFVTAVAQPFNEKKNFDTLSKAGIVPVSIKSNDVPGDMKTEADKKKRTGISRCF